MNSILRIHLLAFYLKGKEERRGEGRGEGGGEKRGALSFIGSLSKCLQQPDLAQDELRGLELRVAGTHDLSHQSCLPPRCTFAETRIPSGKART